MASLFTQIVKGEIPCYKIAEDDQFLAFLDVYPLVEGHVLVVPKKETDYIFDLSQEEYEGLWRCARQVALPLKQAIDCKRIGVAVIGLEVPHAHIHLVPMNQVGDINFTRPKLDPGAQRLQAVAERILKYIS